MNCLASSFFSPEDFLFPELISKSIYTWEILSLMEEFLTTYCFSGIHGTVEPGVFLKNESQIEIAENAYVESGAYLVGPCIIGPYTQIRHGAYLRGGVITSNHCILGHCTEAKNVYLGNHAKAAHFAYLGDSVLGAGVNLGAGVRCANFRLDEKNITVRSESLKIDTQRRKLGGFLGKNASVGCNTVINPGHHIPAYSMIGPGKTI